MEIRRAGEFTFVGETTNTSRGFRHNADLFRDNNSIGEGVARYTNRTYELYMYQTVFIEAVEDAYKCRNITLSEKEMLLSILKTSI